jgi:probable phosphoglycerate mutase
VHSPLGRTAETARAIGDAIRSASPGGLETAVPVRPDERLLEIAQGQWEGRLAADIRADDGDRLRAWRRHPTEAWAPGGERLIDVQARVAPALSDLLSELADVGEPGSLDAPQVGGYDGSTTHPWSIIVGHDGVFKIVLLTLFELPLGRFWMWSSDLGGITIVEFRAGRPVIRAANLTDHLGGLLDEAAQAALEERAESGAL